jgi:hypothetical protein
MFHSEYTSSKLQKYKTTYIARNIWISVSIIGILLGSLYPFSEVEGSQ